MEFGLIYKVEIPTNAKPVQVKAFRKKSALTVGTEGTPKT